MRAMSDREVWRKHTRIGTVDECWEWTGSLTRGGYGNACRRGRNVKAHRMAYEMVTGPIPAGLLVRHTCDNRACVNPRHLIAGTHAQNSDDMRSRGRSPNRHGARNPRAVLTEEAVTELRSVPPTRGDRRPLAAKHGVSISTIDRVRKGACWRVVT